MKAGVNLPNVTFKTRVRDESIEGPNPFRWEDKTTADYFAGKRVVLFPCPALSPPPAPPTSCPALKTALPISRRRRRCDLLHVGERQLCDEQMGRSPEAENVGVIPDGSGEFTRKMGMLVAKDNLGFGARSWRYAAVVNDGVVEGWFEEPGL